MTRRRVLYCESLDERTCPAVFGNVWPNPQLTISFVPDGTDVNGVPSRLGTLFSGVSATQWQGEILRAAQTWANAANIDFAVVPDQGLAIGTAGAPQHDRRFGDIRVAAVPLTGVLALGHPFDLAAGTRSGDLWLNSATAFSITSPTGVDLYSVALHEIGHALGLPGSDDPNSVMYQSILPTPRTGLSAQDIAFVRSKYGARTADRFEGSSSNETIATAPEPSRGGTNVPSDWIILNADLTTTTDQDVYKVRPNNLRGGGLVVEVKTAGQSLVHTKLEILNAAGQVLLTTSAIGDQSLLLANADEHLTYFVRVSSSDPTFNLGHYTLRIYPQLTTSSQPGEDDLKDPESGSDDSIGSANIPDQNFPDVGPQVDYALESSLSSATDQDVYRIRAPRAPDRGPVGSLTLVVWAENPALLDPELTVTDESGVTIPSTILSREGGAFTLQVASALSDQRFYVTVRHSPFGPSLPVGNYFFAAKFGDGIAALSDFGRGFLTVESPVTIRPLIVPQTQTLHMLITAGAGSPTSGVRVSVLDAQDHILLSRFAYASETVSSDPFLPVGTYRLFVATGSLDNSPLTSMSYAISGFAINDPIGPKLFDPNLPPTTPPPPPPPPVAVGPSVPQTPIIPVAPTGPNWFITPPSQWPAPPSTALRPTSPPPPTTKTFSVSTAGHGVTSYNPDRSVRFTINPFPGFTGDIRIAEADMTGDGVADLVVGTGPGIATDVKVYDGVSSALLFEFQPFEASFLGGVSVSLGDVTGDGRADLAVTPDEGGGPRVRLFSGNGFAQINDFYGIDDPNFRGGARTAFGDFDGDGIGDLIVAAGFGGGPRIAGYAGPSLVNATPQKIFNDFFAFEQSLRNGAYVAAGDINGDGYADLVAGGGPGGGPRVFVLDGQSLVNSAGNLLSPLANFFAGSTSDRGGIHVAVKDLDGDTRLDIVTSAGPNSDGRVEGFFDASLQANPNSPFPNWEMTPFDTASQGVFIG